MGESETSYRAKQAQVVRELAERSGPREGEAHAPADRRNHATWEGRGLAFVATPTPEQRAEIAERVIAPLLAEDPRHYYYGRDSLHVTVKNVRTVAAPRTFDDDDVQSVISAMESLVPDLPAFEFEMEDTLCLQGSAMLVGYTDERFHEFVVRTGEALAAAGVPDDKRYARDDVFFGNMTVCRFLARPTRGLVAALRDVMSGWSFHLPVDRIELVSSNKVGHPDGRIVYREFALGAV